MHPLICKIGPLSIYSYGLMLAIAFTVSSILLRLQARKENISTDIIFNLSFLVFISGIIGARLLYIVQNLTYYLKNPLEIIMLAHGGLSWFGGLISGVISGVIYIKKKNLSAYKIFDLLIPFVALGQAIGRIGCLLNGCCFGRIFNIPIQIYSSVLLVFIFIILRFLQERPHREGKIFFIYLLLYSLKRFFIEFWRKDSARIFFGLTLFQLLSIVLFYIAFRKLTLLKKSKN